VLMIRRVRHRCRCRRADQHICGAGRTRMQTSSSNRPGKPCPLTIRTRY